MDDLVVIESLSRTDMSWLTVLEDYDGALGSEPGYGCASVLELSTNEKGSTCLQLKTIVAQ